MGVLPGIVRRLPDGVKRPQMQWNRLDHGPTAMLAGIDDPAWVYFVHSFAPEPSPDVVATCDYGGPVVAAVQRDRLWATQFHPEKSGDTGLRILANFVAAAAATPSSNR
jgi:glutamine amidotransferase